jgi:hypothetical protein
MWIFLNAHYRITYNKKCSTHVHVSIDGGFPLLDLLHIACAAMWFESAIEALVPSGRRGNPFCKSNCLDNPNFAGQNLTRAQAMARAMQCQTQSELIGLMCPGEYPDSKYFAWNFTVINKYNTIEFRKGSASVSEDLAFGWIEIAVRFVPDSKTAGYDPDSRNITRQPRQS